MDLQRESAPPRGLGLLWGARVIARGFDLPWDRHGWAGRDAGSTPARKRWHGAFLGEALDRARERARLMDDDEVAEVARRTAIDDGWEAVMVARKAGGYVYLSAGLVPAGAQVLS
jgi:hypothetical protein